MKRVLCPQLPKPGRPAPLSHEEGEHLVRVLRLRDGDPVEAMDGQGRSARVTLRVRGADRWIEHRADEPRPQERLDPIAPVVLEMSVLKGEAMEWVVEKSVELGVKTLRPVLTAHTVVQIKNKGPQAFRERWQKIADQALKQCGRLERMGIELPLSLEEALARHEASEKEPRLWCDEAGRSESVFLQSWLDQTKNQDLRSVHILIGPEGGWSGTERERLQEISRRTGTRRVALGPWVLRAETAAIFTVSLVTARLACHNKIVSGEVS